MSSLAAKVQFSSETKCQLSYKKKNLHFFLRSFFSLPRFSPSCIIIWGKQGYLLQLFFREKCFWLLTIVQLVACNVSEDVFLWHLLCGMLKLNNSAYSMCLDMVKCLKCTCTAVVALPSAFWTHRVDPGSRWSKGRLGYSRTLVLNSHLTNLGWGVIRPTQSLLSSPVTDRITLNHLHSRGGVITFRDGV